MIEISDSEIISQFLEHGFWTFSAQSKDKPLPLKKSKALP
jgi:hypothetical protein